MIDNILLLISEYQHFHFLRPYWLLVFFLMLYILNAFSLRDDSIAQWRELSLLHRSPPHSNYQEGAGNSVCQLDFQN